MKFPTIINEQISLVFSLILLMLSASAGFGQSKSDLKKDQAALEKKLRLTEELLRSNSESQSVSMARLEVLKSQIKTRKELLEIYEKDLAQVKNQLTKLDSEIAIIKNKRQRLETNYAHLLRSSYRSKLAHNRWLFLLSSSSFHEVLLRWKYLRKINESWKKQIEIWSNTNLKLLEKQKALDGIAAKRSAVLKKAKQESRDLELDQKKIAMTIASLNQNAKELKKAHRNYTRSMERLRKTIESVVDEGQKTNRTTNLPLTPALAKLAASFEANKGSLPWPVMQGVIYRGFGTQRHPTLPNVKVKNNGIDIQTLPQSPVKAVFKGTVVAMQMISGVEYMVIMSHGHFYTVYSNLTDVTVAKGDKINVGGRLGSAAEKDGVGQVHLELWEGKKILNPHQWLQQN